MTTDFFNGHPNCQEVIRTRIRNSGLRIRGSRLENSISGSTPVSPTWPIVGTVRCTVRYRLRCFDLKFFDKFFSCFATFHCVSYAVAQIVSGTTVHLFVVLMLFPLCVELLCTYALITVFVDYLTFMSFYPSGLSLAIELMFTKTGRPQWDVKQIIKMLPQEETQNSVVYRYRYFLLLTVLFFSLNVWRLRHCWGNMVKEVGEGNGGGGRVGGDCVWER